MKNSSFKVGCNLLGATFILAACSGKGFQGNTPQTSDRNKTSADKNAIMQEPAQPQASTQSKSLPQPQRSQDSTPACVPKSNPDVSSPAPGVSALAGFFTSAILSSYASPAEVGGTAGQTSGDGSGGQNGFRFEGPAHSENYYSELEVMNENWTHSAGFVGITDQVHWDKLNWSSTTGVRLMHYLGANFSFGEGTGTTISKDCFAETYRKGDILGIIVNKQKGTTRLYKNGTFIASLSNPAMKGVQMYIAVSDWAYKKSLAAKILTQPSVFAGRYSYE